MLKTKRTPITAADALRRIVLAWLSAAALWSCVPALPGSFWAFAGTVGFLFAVLCLLPFGSKWERWGIPAAFAAVWLQCLRESFSWGTAGAGAVLLAISAVYALKGWQARQEAPLPAARQRKGSAAAVWILGLGVFLLISAWTVFRVLTFSSPTFDMGIFSQMFHSMRTTGLPDTTVERDGLLSHFAVHVSPIWYLLLPVYCIVPHPATLQVLQAAVVASAAVPAWKLARLHGCHGWLRVALCAIVLLYPAYAGGTSYDIHENCFLTPLLLWLLYALDSRKWGLSVLFGSLTLLVKEDAAVYVAVVGLWQLVRCLLRGDYRGAAWGGALLAAAVGWFLAVTGYLDRQGDGVMTYRYGNFMEAGSGSLLTVVKTVLMDPGKLLQECLEQEKLPFLAQTLLCVLGLPLLTRRYERYILLIPYILINLMPDYQYQHSIFFQYTFGSWACLFYLTLVNVADLQPRQLKLTTAWAAAALTAVCFCAWVLPKAVSYPRDYLENRQHYTKIAEALDTVPEDVSVTATTWYTTWLSQRAELYDVRYSSREHLLSTAYVVIDPRGEDSFAKYGGYETLIKLLEREGYALVYQEETLEIYHRSNQQ